MRMSLLPLRPIVLLGLTILPFLLIKLFPGQLFYVMDMPTYLVFHNVVEFVCIVVSLSIFGVGWFTYEQSRDRHALFLSVAFLAIGLMDSMHTLSYAGMPDFFTANSPNKSTQFWIAARFFTAASLLGSAWVFQNTKSRWLSKPVLMTGAIAVTGVVFGGITFFPESMPAAYISGVGLTSLKTSAEYVIVVLFILAVVAYWRRMVRTGDPLLRYYLCAFFLCAISELALTRYKSVFDTYNVLGHGYKALAFYLIYKRVISESVGTPYVQLAAANERLQTDFVERQRTEGRLQRLNRELRAISTCNQTVLRATDEQALLHECCRIVYDEAGYRMAWVGFAESDDAKSVRPVAWAGVEDGYLASANITWADTERGHGPSGTAIRTGLSACIQDFLADPRVAPWREAAQQRGYRSSIALPLKDDRAVTFGALCIYSVEPNAFTAGEVRLLEELADDLAFGVSVLRTKIERKRAEQEIALLSFALNNVREAALLIDETARFRYVNEEACRVLRYTRQELLGLGVPDIDPDFPTERWPRHWDELKARRSLSFEGLHRTKDGRTFPVEINANYLEYDGNAYNLALVRDITERRYAEDVLRTSHERYRKAEAIGHVGNWEYNLQTAQFWGSDEAKRIYGFDPERAEFSTVDVEDCIPEKERVHQALVDLIEAGKPYNLEFEIHPLNSSVPRIITSVAELQRDEHGAPLKVVGFIQDVTERKRAEEELRFRNAILSTQQEATIDGILVVDENAMIVSYNRRFVEMWGVPQAFVDNKIDEPVLQHMMHQMADPVTFLRRVQYLYEHRQKTSQDELLLADGRVFDRYSAPMFGMDGRHYGRVWYFRDITKRKREQEELVRLATAIEQAAETIVITDAQANIVYVNPSFERTSGYSRQDALGKNPRILQSGRHDAAFYRQMWDTLTRGAVWHGHLINQRKDGTFYEEEAIISPVRDASGGVVNYTALKLDVTHQAELEAQLRQAQKMEAIGRLAGGVAHDFNNLLMGIMGYAELCRDSIAPDHPIRGWLDEITHDAERSAEITRQLLAFARKQTVAPRVLDLNDAVAGMLKLLRRLIGEDIGLTWRPGVDMRQVRIDPVQVDQILANLCVDARDAITGVGKIILETGSIVLDAEYCTNHPEAIPGAYVFLAVSDDGCGMDKETLAQVFEPFFTTKGLGKGTGLGLSTVYGIVKQNNGFIHASSEPGKGTTFTIYLPEIATETVPTTVISEAEVPRGRGETILLVEDEKSLRVTCSALLDGLGYKVMVAENPGEALKITDQHPGDIHVLLTDVVMPGMDVQQLVQRITAVKPGVKVVFMSGYPADMIAHRGVLDEGVYFLSKPFTRDDLARKVRQVLEAD